MSRMMSPAHHTRHARHIRWHCFAHVVKGFRETRSAQRVRWAVEAARALESFGSSGNE
jgi:hypothetical protein